MRSEKQIDSLPYEIVLKIFSYLSLTEIKNISLTCKFLQEISNNSNLWKSAIPFIETISPSIDDILNSPRYQLIHTIAINIESKDLAKTINGVFLINSVKHIILFSKETLNNLVEKPEENELTFVGSDIEDFIRGIHYSRIKTYNGPKKCLELPIKAISKKLHKLREISITESILNKDQLFELLKVISLKEGSDFIKVRLKSNTQIQPRTKDTHILSLANTLCGLSARLNAIIILDRELRKLHIDQSCVVLTNKSKFEIDYTTINGHVPCLDIISALSNIKGKEDNLTLSVAAKEVSALIVSIQDQPNL